MQNSEKMDSSANKSTNLDTVMPLMLEQLKAGGSFRFGPHGTSMLPMIRQGIDSVTVSPINGRLKKYDLPFYRRDNGQYVLHRILKVTEDSYTCIGDNQFVYEKGVRDDQLIGYVTSFYRADKEIKVTSLSYRFYCRFWHYTRHPRRILRNVRARLRRIFKK